MLKVSFASCCPPRGPQLGRVLLPPLREVGAGDVRRYWPSTVAAGLAGRGAADGAGDGERVGVGVGGG
jgi:hypothetical protein